MCFSNKCDPPFSLYELEEGDSAVVHELRGDTSTDETR